MAMSRIKGRYVATVEVDFDAEREPGMIPIEEIQERFRNNTLTEMIQETLATGFYYGKVQVTQQYADIYEVEE